MIAGRFADLQVLGLQEGLSDLAGDGGAISLFGLWGGARALVLGEIARALKRPLVVVTPTLREAEEVTADLRFFLDRDQVNLFPEPEVPPFQPVSPPLEIRAERMQRLRELRDEELKALVLPIHALFRRFLPPDALDSATVRLYPHRIVPPEQVVELLEVGGYRSVPQVEQAGEYSRRGGILDIGLSHLLHPVRIEFFGDEIESIRTFDVGTQRSLSGSRRVDGVTIFPLSEVLLSAESRGLARRRTAGQAPPLVQEAVEMARSGPGVERYLPYFHRHIVPLWEYFSPGTILVWDDPDQVMAKAEATHALLLEEYKRHKAEGLPPLTATHLRWKEIHATLASRPRIDLFPFSPPPGEQGAPFVFETKRAPSYQGRFTPLVRDLGVWCREGRSISLVARGTAQAQRLCEVLREHDVGATVTDGPPAPGRVHILEGGLSAGFHFAPLKQTYLTEAEIFGPRRGVSVRRPKIRQSRALDAFEDLKPGNVVVHLDHGIGRFHGLEKITVGEVEGDCLLLQYAGGDKLYVPVDKLHLVQRYVGADAAAGGPPLDRLGSNSWARAKERVRASIREMAGELVKLYAARQVAEGFACAPDTPWQREFEAAFPFEETADQMAAIRQVKADMERPQPMDRLICGDVGYGKTEVAMRAAFKAVMDGKQVAVLVPTTVLALQHLQTFSDRFAPFPIVVEMLSRFRTRGEQQKVLRGLRDGTVDIVIGTHRLLQKDIRFRDLGLLAVDEEQRFGVAAKERLKQFRTEVDVLTLTATPIPRTLHMAMLGVRDISTIETPPEDRLSIRTYVTRFDPEVIRRAVEEEIGRGGQVFFVHNRVESIHTMARFLKRLVPHVKIAVAHGQMAEGALERVMCDFYAKRYQLLCCTAIIESGLDIPTTNTIIINRADRFGLAQLYQLRGRVGRDRFRAHAYLLIPREEALNESARKRLQVLAELTELGSGFKIAAMDLEIRGAGNLLGVEQHGHVNAVGFDLYCQLIQETVQELKGATREVVVDPVLRLPIEAYIPEAYVSDAVVRLALYRRLSAATSSEERAELAGELRDRFGTLPPAVEHLLVVLDLKARAQSLRIREIDARRETVKIAFGPTPPVPPERIVVLLQAMRGGLRYLPEDTLEFECEGTLPLARIARVKALLDQMQEPCGEPVRVSGGS
ncbi:MAG: transcription-repair coupling factor [candidate division NC10 bacterium]|jgi:transcription-repair coupling factor (superfamily II helicase)|nr:transcription-repair coupling factor [candidate division NC10 bacterium]MCZ6549875.1 transcription-repair coupling factor [candidate division NC10 bacterium]